MVCAAPGIQLALPLNQTCVLAECDCSLVGVLAETNVVLRVLAETRCKYKLQRHKSTLLRLEPSLNMLMIQVPKV